MSSDTIVRQAAIPVELSHSLPESQRADLKTFIDRVAGGHAHVYEVEYDVIDAPLLRVRRFRRDELGRTLVQDDHLVTDVAEHPVRGSLPIWWQP